MGMMNETQRSPCMLISVLTTLALTALTMSAQARRQPKPLVGFPVGPKMNEIVPKRFIVDPPTIENLGFRWYIEGDSNRNASVTVEFRKKGQAQWKNALPMLRVHHEVVNQAYGPYRTGNLFAGSVLFLEPATIYEIRFTMSDPDGGAPTKPKIVSATTRAEPRAFKALASALDEAEAAWKEGGVGSCEALYRITPELADEFRQQGCLSVDNGEVAALYALAKERDIPSGVLLQPYIDLEGGWRVSYMGQKYADGGRLQAQAAIEAARILLQEKD